MYNLCMGTDKCASPALAPKHPPAPLLPLPPTAPRPHPARNWDVMELCNGILCGLVAVTAGCGIIDPWAGIIVGILSAFVFQAIDLLMLRLRVDDVVAAVPMHMGCGCLGMLFVGFFARQEFVTDFYGVSATGEWGGGVDGGGVKGSAAGECRGGGRGVLCMGEGGQGSCMWCVQLCRGAGCVGWECRGHLGCVQVCTVIQNTHPMLVLASHTQAVSSTTPCANHLTLRHIPAAPVCPCTAAAAAAGARRWGVFFGGDGTLLAAQVISVICVIAWVCVTLVPYFWLMRFLNVVRVPMEQELEGLDASKYHVITTNELPAISGPKPKASFAG